MAKKRNAVIILVIIIVATALILPQTGLFSINEQKCSIIRDEATGVVTKTGDCTNHNNLFSFYTVQPLPTYVSFGNFYGYERNNAQITATPTCSYEFDTACYKTGNSCVARVCNPGCSDYPCSQFGYTWFFNYESPAYPSSASTGTWTEMYFSLSDDSATSTAINEGYAVKNLKITYSTKSDASTTSKKGYVSTSLLSCSQSGCNGGSMLTNSLLDSPQSKVIATVGQSLPNVILTRCQKLNLPEWVCLSVSTDKAFRVVDCYSDSDCTTGQTCQKSGDWTTWKCGSQTCKTNADTNCNGAVDRDELGSSITKWTNGQITREELGSAIQAWAI